MIHGPIMRIRTCVRLCIQLANSMVNGRNKKFLKDCFATSLSYSAILPLCIYFELLISDIYDSSIIHLNCHFVGVKMLENCALLCVTKCRSLMITHEVSI